MGWIWSRRRRRPGPAPGRDWLEDDERRAADAVRDDLAREAAQRLGAEPDPALVLHQDPRTLDAGRSVRYMLSIPTNVLMIISSSLGYFFFSGLTTFALLFVIGHYHVSQASLSWCWRCWSAAR